MNPASRRRARKLLALLTAMITTVFGYGARADELRDFERARQLYDRQQYSEAAEQLEDLVGGEVPALQSRALLLESRKYLGASYLFLGKETQAARQFELLLEQDANYQLDPVAFPVEVQASFSEARDRVQRRIAEKEAAARTERVRKRREQAERIQRAEARISQLEALARLETVERVNSRWIALMPFGAGQFQNGHRALGWTLALTQGALAATSLTTFVLHNSLRDQDPAADALDGARSLEQGLRLSNQISTALLLATMVLGVVDAQLRFVPSIRTQRERLLPAERSSMSPSGRIGAHGSGFGFRF